MFRVTRRTAWLCGVVALGACSSSESPKPTLAGTWQVAIHSFNKGSISPSTFAVSVWASGDSFIVSMPTLTWTGGPSGATEAFNLPPTMVRFSTDTLTGFGASIFGIPGCGSVTISGHPNASKDTLESAVVTIADTMVTFGSTTACESRWTGSVTASKAGNAGSPPAPPPAPNPVGTWHVTVAQLTSGTLTTPFDMVIANDSQATVPSLTWTVNSTATAYDSLSWFGAHVDTVSAGMRRHTAQNSCQVTTLYGEVRADTMVGTAFVADTNAMGHSCQVLSYGTFRAVR